MNKIHSKGMNETIIFTATQIESAIFPFLLQFLFGGHNEELRNSTLSPGSICGADTRTWEPNKGIKVSKRTEEWQTSLQYQGEDKTMVACSAGTGFQRAWQACKRLEMDRM